MKLAPAKLLPEKLKLLPVKLAPAKLTRWDFEAGWASRGFVIAPD